jgi:hypothetical protein
MSVSLPDSVERWRRLLALVAAGHLTQTMLPPTWVSLVFGRIVTEPIGHLIPASMLTACTSPWGATLCSVPFSVTITRLALRCMPLSRTTLHNLS